MRAQWRPITLCAFATLALTGCDDEADDLCADVDCGAHGSCVADDGACQCDTGYIGDSCEACDEGYGAEGDLCVAMECRGDDECDDGLACNGLETCGDDHICADGSPVECGDHEVCEEPDGTCACDEASELVDGVCVREVLADLDDLTLDAESFWNGADGSGSFESGAVTFFNAYDAEYESWDGFAYSNTTDTTTAGFDNQYSAITGGGVDGSANYAVAYESSFSPIGPPTLNVVDPDGGEAVTIAGAYITNTTLAYISMRDGDAYSKQFGGETGTDPDWFLLTIQGIRADASLTDPVELYLADFRADDAQDDYILDEWTWVDLSGLGDVVGLQFTMSSSDNGEWGMNTPAFFALDGLMRHGR